MGILRAAILTGFMIALCACGFKLEGSEPLPPELQKLAVVSDTPYNPFINQLRTNLLDRHATILDDPTQAPYILSANQISLTTTQTSVAASQQTRQYTISYSVLFELKNHAGESILKPFTITKSSPLTLFNNQVISNSNLVPQIEATLQRQVLIQLFDHLQAINWN